MSKKVLIQGYSGAFHEEAANEYFDGENIEIVPAMTFEILAEKLSKDKNIDFAMMAIENSIAGSLLQNYRLLRENNFLITGEIYLRIKHNLMVLPGQKINDIKEVISHPMALNQSMKYLKSLNGVRLIETEDTALSAKKIAEEKLTKIAAIASKTAAKLYGLDILAESIETSDVNYTRFFVIKKNGIKPHITGDENKASIYIRVKDEKGSLLNVLNKIAQYDINMSKLQSYPVMGSMSEYYFHIDLEFEDVESYKKLIDDIKECTLVTEELGVYKKHKLALTENTLT